MLGQDIGEEISHRRNFCEGSNTNTGQEFNIPRIIIPMRGREDGSEGIPAGVVVPRRGEGSGFNPRVGVFSHFQLGFLQFPPKHAH